MKTIFTSILFLTLSLVSYADEKSSDELNKGVSCVTPPPPTIITNSVNLSVCPNTSVFLQATGTGTISWYSVPTGGTAITTGNSVNIGVGTSNITFYAEANDAGCISLTRTAVTATIINQPAAPSNVTPLINKSTCALISATLTASSSSPISWYTTASTLTPISTGSVYVTPSNYAQGTYTFYAAAQNSCGFSVRTPITYTVNFLPFIYDNTSAANGNICSNASTTLNVGSSETNISWYSAPTGGTLLGTGITYITPSLTNTTSFYPIATTAQGCTEATTVTVAVYKSPTDISNVGAQNICYGQSTILSASSAPGSTRWYNAATGGTLLASVVSVNTGTLVTTTTFYAENNNAYCIPPRTPITVTVTPIPLAPVNITPAGNQSLCFPNSTATLSASGVGTLNWYTTPTGGTSSATGNTYTISPIINTTTYYVSDQVGNCISATRTPITVTVTTVSSPAFTGSASISICSGNTASLTASSPGPISWFASSTGTTALTTGTVYTTPTLTSNTSYYISTTSNGCESPRAVKTVTVKPIPSAPVDVTVSQGSFLNICSGESTTLFTNNYSNWFNVPSGGAMIAGGSQYSTPSLTTNTTYYTEFNPNGCPSLRTPITVTVSACTGIMEAQKLNAVTLQPNPASTFFTLNNVVEGTIISVIDVTGKVVTSNSVIDADKTMTIETDNLSNGIYIIQLKNSGAVAHKKLIISK
jgi:hypothetical protein